MKDFAKYAFNKSHAACYAVVAYQTAYLKVHFPVQYMAWLISSVTDKTSKVAEYILAAREMGVVFFLLMSINQLLSSVLKVRT